MVEKEETLFLDEAEETEGIKKYGTKKPYPSKPVLGKIKSVKQLRRSVRGTPLTWRLDAIAAIDGLL